MTISKTVRKIVEGRHPKLRSFEHEGAREHFVIGSGQMRWGMPITGGRVIDRFQGIGRIRDVAIDGARVAEVS